MFGETLTVTDRARNWRYFFVAFFSVVGLFIVMAIWGDVRYKQADTELKRDVVQFCDDYLNGNGTTEECPSRVLEDLDELEREGESGEGQ